MAHLYPHFASIKSLAPTRTSARRSSPPLSVSPLPLYRCTPPPMYPPMCSLHRRAGSVSGCTISKQTVSTGALTDSDDAHIAKYAPSAQYRTLYRFSEPVSPHLAVELERRAKLAEREVGQEPQPPSDEEFVRDVGDWIHAAAAKERGKGVAYVETAGGVHSPGPSGVCPSRTC